MDHFFGLSDALCKKGVPIIHSLKDFALHIQVLTRLALSCSKCLMAAYTASLT
jgi:hypothetical protein